jgi:hypothetical protein
MALVRGYRVKETTTTTGTGTYNLGGAATNFQTFVAGIGDANTCYYACEDGTDWEVGIGTVTDASPDTLARTTVNDSSNNGSAVNWGAGTRNIFCTTSAEDPVLVGTANTWTNTNTFSSTITANGNADFNADITYKRAYTDVVTLTDQATISWDVDDGHMAKVTLGGNRTLGALSNLTAGFTGVLYVIQDGTGGRTLAFNAAYNFVAGAAPTVSSGASEYDILYMTCWDGTNVDVAVGQNFS